MKSNVICKMFLTPSLRFAKVEVLNENPLVEIYEDVLTQKEFNRFVAELANYTFQPGTVWHPEGNVTVTFKMEKDVFNMDNKVVDDTQKIFDELTGLFPDENDYTQVHFNRCAE